MAENGHPRTFDDLVRVCQGLVEHVGSGFDQPDDDWVPVALLATPDGKMNIVAMAMLPKERWAAVIKGAVLEFGASFGAAVLSSWTAQAGTEEQIDRIYRDYGSLENYPLRKEIVLLECASPERHETWQAEIIRSEDAPPRLGEWERMSGDGLTSGRMAGLMTDAFAAGGNA